MKQGKPIDAQILEMMASQCPPGKEADFLIGVAAFGFNIGLPVYRKAIERGFKKREESKSMKEETNHDSTVK